MSAFDSYGFPTGYSGWSCPTCGAFVPTGTSHLCDITTCPPPVVVNVNVTFQAEEAPTMCAACFGKGVSPRRHPDTKPGERLALWGLCPSCGGSGVVWVEGTRRQ